MNNTEKTLSIIKPDAVERNLIGQIVSIFEKNSLIIHSIKKITLSKKMAEDFYFVHKERPFFNDLCTYISSGPVVVMVLEGNNSVVKNREIMGATNPKDAAKGTIRNLYGISLDKNSVHGSDSKENAKIEIDFFFKE
jgi:nucleoside-diphosphate kinase